MDIQPSIHRQTDFSLQFLKEALDQSVGKNCVFSPLSIFMASSLAAGGARGATLEQFYTCLNFTDVNKLHQFSSHLINVVLADESVNGGRPISFVNGLWVDQSMTLKPNYRDLVKNHYNTEVNTVNFINKPNEARLAVNEWAAEESKGKIQDFLPPDSVSQDTRLILANALYLKGAWQKKFDPSATKEGTFNLLNGESVQVPMMTTKKKQYITILDDCKILYLPYFHGQDRRCFSMYIILPNDINGLPELERKIDLNFLEHHLYLGNKVEVRSFQLPRFKISSSINATEILKKMGLVLPFTDGANFNDMVECVGGSLCISEVYHSSYVEVNEEGTEAAALTAFEFEWRYATTYPIEDFVADHPFMFVIKEDQSGIILFVGHVLNPSES